MTKSWIQHPITLELIPRDEYVRPKEASHFIHNDLQPFVSPIDGSVISDRRQYRNHCDKHGVRPAAEFPPEHYAKKAKEREAHYKGQSSKEETLKRKQALNEIINHHEYAQRG